MPSLKDAAESYARDYGIAVHALRARSKEPATTHGFKDATTDAEALGEWWSLHPDHNIGGSMGSPSGGICCIDIDVDDDLGKDGMEYVRAWEREHGELPETAMAITGRGGCHMFYRFAEPPRKYENEELSIDFRGEGSYAMLAPSVHPNGRTVEWENDPCEYGFADADGNVIAFVEWARPKSEKQGSREKKVDVNKRVSKGGRNKALFKALCSARSAGFDDAAMEAFAQTYNSMQLDPPLDAFEVRKTLESAMGYEPGNKEKDESEKRPNRPAFKHNVCARELIEKRGACFIDGMPAIRSGGIYRTGWRAIDDAIIDMADDVTRQKQNEVHHYLTVKAPHVEQSRPTLIGFENGVLDVLTMGFRGYTDSDVIPNVIPHRWNPSAECETVDRTIEKLACGDVGMEMNMTETIGLCMYRSSTHYPFYPVLMGSGSNGKSTFIGMIRSVIGKENMSALQPREIGMRFQASMLVGKLANLGDDISNDYLDGDSCSQIKKIATGDPIHTDVKGGEGFDFTPYVTMVFSANKFPRLADTTDGMMRRLFPMPFKAKFSPSDPDFDPMIGEKLRSEEAAEYMCVIGVEGLRRVMAQNAMTPNEESVKINKKIRVDNSSVLQWIEDVGMAAEDAIGRTKDEIYARYKSWCADNGAQYIGSRNFGEVLRTEWHIALCQMDHREFSGGRKTVRVYGYEKR